MYNEIEGTTVNQRKKATTTRSQTHQKAAAPAQDPTLEHRARQLHQHEKKVNRRVAVASLVLGVTSLALITTSVFLGVSAGRTAAASRKAEYEQRGAQSVNRHYGYNAHHGHTGFNRDGRYDMNRADVNHLRDNGRDVVRGGTTAGLRDAYYYGCERGKCGPEFTVRFDDDMFEYMSFLSFDTEVKQAKPAGVIVPERMKERVQKAKQATQQVASYFNPKTREVKPAMFLDTKKETPRVVSAFAPEQKETVKPATSFTPKTETPKTTTTFAPEKKPVTSPAQPAGPAFWTPSSTDAGQSDTGAKSCVCAAQQ